MPNVLKVAMGSLAAVVLSSAVALAQTPPPNSGAGQTPTSSGQSKPHKRSAKKAGHKKAAKKKTAKKAPQ